MLNRPFHVGATANKCGRSGLQSINVLFPNIRPASLVSGITSPSIFGTITAVLGLTWLPYSARYMGTKYIKHRARVCNLFSSALVLRVITKLRWFVSEAVPNTL